MTTLDKIRTFLRDNSEVSVGYNELTFFTVDELDEGQVGFSVDDNNNSLITGQEGDWKEEWLVIGIDGLIGDPIFVDTSSKQLQVLTAAHGEGEWEPIPIADTLDSFSDIIQKLKKISVNRTSPVDLEKNPISAKEKKQFIAEIKKNNANSDIDYWENFLEED
jgi:hypothetical protein